MHKGDTIPGLLVAAFGLSFFIATLTNAKLTVQAATSDGVPGAGFFPYFLGLILMALGAVLFLKGLWQKGSVQYFTLSDEGKQNMKILFLTIAGLLAFFALWKFSGQFVISALVMCLYMNWIFQRPLKFNIIYSVVLAAFIYLVFTVAFSIQFVI